MDQFVSELRGNGRGMMTRNLQERFTLAVTQTLSVGSHCFRVDLAGPQEGELVLLLHGYPNSRHSWREFHGPLSEHGFRTVVGETPRETKWWLRTELQFSIFPDPNH